MLVIKNVLSAEDAATVRDKLLAAPFKDGKATAGTEARKVKANQQAVASDPSVQALAKFVRQAMERNGVFVGYVRPARWTPLMFNRYGPGETYGLHMDDTFMGPDGAKLRSDLSFTLFLAEPDTYEGGELVVSSVEGDRSVRGAAGSLVVYSTGALHRVEPVRAGVRLAAVGWIQSQVRRADQRELLFDLARVRASMNEGEPRLLVDKTVSNLLRMWGAG